MRARALLPLIVLGVACGRSEPLLGRDLTGRLPPPLAGAPATPARATPARATLVRFWTDRCPHCAATLPAIEALRERYAPRGLATLAIYHPKPAREVEVDEVRAAARAVGYEGPLALDAGWQVLQGLRPQAGRTAPTSYAVLLDGAGRVRWFHPGPRFFPSDDPAQAAEDAAHRGLVAAIEALLAD